MSTLDDPVIPDDLSDLLRTGSKHLEVSPAALRSVEHRARRRRHRRHALAASGASGAAVLLLLASLAAVHLASRDEGQTVTATDPDTSAVGSVPQPLLIPGGYRLPVDASDGLVEGVDLDHLTNAGRSLWWETGKGRQPVGAAVLADGRRFGISMAGDVVRHDLTASLDEIGAGGQTESSRPLDTSTADGASVTRSLIGASGTEVVLQRTADRPVPDQPGTRVVTASEIVALDVDSGTERVLATDTGTGVASAAGGQLAFSGSTDCTIRVLPLDGNGADRRLAGGCPEGIHGLTGLAQRLAVSPDGRWAAVVWTMIHNEGEPNRAISIIDLDDGHLDQVLQLGPKESADALAWTGDDAVTLAIGGSETDATYRGGRVRIALIGYDLPGGN